MAAKVRLLVCWIWGWIISTLFSNYHIVFMGCSNLNRPKINLYFIYMILIDSPLMNRHPSQTPKCTLFLLFLLFLLIYYHINSKYLLFFHIILIPHLLFEEPMHRLPNPYISYLLFFLSIISKPQLSILFLNFY